MDVVTGLEIAFQNFSIIYKQQIWDSKRNLDE